MLPILKTKRLLLRDLKETDWEAVSYLRSDPMINKYVQRPAAETKQKAIAFIHKIQTSVAANSIFYWCITEFGQHEMLGSICLWNFSEDKSIVEVGYDLNPIAQGKGIMTEALDTVTQFAFDHIKVGCIEAFTHSANVPSRKLLENNLYLLVEGRVDQNNRNNVIYQRNR